MLFKNKYLKLYSVFFLVISLLFGQLSFSPKGSSSKTLILQDDGVVNVPQQLIVNSVEDAYMPRGLIVMWSGSIDSIPAGWALCDGTHATPNLTDRFIVGAGSSYAVGNTGGVNKVVLTEAQMPSHTHIMENIGEHTHGYRDTYPITYSGGTYKIDNYGGEPDDMSGETRTTSETGLHLHSIGLAGGGQAHENRPPYYALAFIKKL